MRHAITLASRYWESKINYLVTDGRVCKRIDVQRRVDQVQFFIKIEAKDQIVLGDVHVYTDPPIEGINLGEVARGSKGIRNQASQSSQQRCRPART